MQALQCRVLQGSQYLGIGITGIHGRSFNKQPCCRGNRVKARFGGHSFIFFTRCYLDIENDARDIVNGFMLLIGARGLRQLV